jgi:hypothetical protein
MNNSISMDVGASNASSPDLDWSQVRETILMLNLSIAQIEIALHDSSISVGELTDSVTSISGLLGSVIPPFLVGVRSRVI